VVSAAERYIRLGLHLGRLDDEMVDAYFGPPELAASVEAEPRVEPRTLASTAEVLLDELEDGWLRDQVVALRTYVGVLAGESRSYADEVEGCYGVRPAYTAEGVFTAAHAQLEELLPGDGPLAERLERWERSTDVPAGRVEGTVAAVVAEARAWTSDLLDLPTGEGVEVEIVRDEPWLAFCHYLGAFRSRISINLDLPLSAPELLRLTMHETYPGHHAERCTKDALLVRDQGILEESLVLVPTPQSLVSEGIAKLAPSIVLASDRGNTLASILRGSGIDLDLPHALSVERAGEPLSWAVVNAALLLHEDGASDAEARAYLERWALLTPGLATHLVRFLNEPASRTYAITYAAGRELCDAYVAAEPDGFRRLLTEQVRVGDLLKHRSWACPPAERHAN
jgi:hypothetical protein